MQRLNLSDGVGGNGSVLVPEGHPFDGDQSIVRLEVYRLYDHAVDTLSYFVQQIVSTGRVLELHGNQTLGQLCALIYSGHFMQLTINRRPRAGGVLDGGLFAQLCF